MAATSSSPFPLATEQPYEYDGNKGNGADLGASGDSSQNSINLSQGGMIAIIVVVVIVSLVGSTSCIYPFNSPPCTPLTNLAKQLPPRPSSSLLRSASGLCAKLSAAQHARL